MTTIFSSNRRSSGFATVILAGLTLAACANPATNGSVRYAENSLPRVMSDAVPVHHGANTLGKEACMDSTQSFVEDCGGFARYYGP